jgi:excisionase family DNA binding protein
MVPAPSSSSGSRLTPYTQLHQTGVGGFAGPRVVWRLAGETFACVRFDLVSAVMKGMNVHTIPPTTSAANAQPPPVVLLSVRDVCAALQCGRTFVYDLLQKGELRAIKLGRLTRISRAVLEEFIARSEGRALDGAWVEQHPVGHRLVGRGALVSNGKISRSPKPSAGESRTVQQCLL